MKDLLADMEDFFGGPADEADDEADPFKDVAPVLPAAGPNPVDDPVDVTWPPPGFNSVGVVFGPYASSIKFYFNGRRLEATCENPDHKTMAGRKCRLSLTIPKNVDPAKPHLGFPLGVCAAFLMDSYHPSCPNGATHRNPFRLKSLPRKKRSECRKELYKVANANLLRKCEHKKPTPDSDTEPETCPYRG